MDMQIVLIFWKILREKGIYIFVFIKFLNTFNGGTIKEIFFITFYSFFFNFFVVGFNLNFLLVNSKYKKFDIQDILLI